MDMVDMIDDAALHRGCLSDIVERLNFCEVNRRQPRRLGHPFGTRALVRVAQYFSSIGLPPSLLQDRRPLAMRKAIFSLRNDELITPSSRASFGASLYRSRLFS